MYFPCEGNYGLIEWTEDWIQFIDTVTQLSILMTPDLSLPTRITCLAIDPEQHKKRLRKIADDSIGLYCGIQYRIIC